MNTCQLFEQLAEHTWRTMDRTYRNGIVFGEDAITSILLDRICDESPYGIVIEDTRPKESMNGCDFELWVGNSFLGWSRYAIQAKKLNIRTQRYGSLNHMSGGTPQIDILEKYAKANGAFPLYCLYNWSDSVSTSHCSSPTNVEQFGCSVTPSRVIREALAIRGAKSFSKIHAKFQTLPWRCLVCCPQLTNPSKYAPRSGWETRINYHYEELPDSLIKLMERGAPAYFSESDGLFDRRIELLPRYIAVVEISQD